MTDRSRRVLRLASLEAERLDQAELGTEHLLLGLIKEGSGVAAHVLLEMGVDLNRARSEVERFTRRGTECVLLTTRMPLTSQLECVIAWSREEALKLGHRSVGTEHLLLALVRDTDGVATQVLRNCGIAPEAVTKHTLFVLGFDPGTLIPMMPPKLAQGSGVRVVAPARSLSLPWMSDELQARARTRLEELGLVVSFGQHVHEMDEFSSSSIEHRVDDLHAAFADPAVQLVHTVIGGFNSNQLLQYLDYDLIGQYPKILCGFSDITALANAIYAKTGLVTYSGPHFFNFGVKHGVEFTLEHFTRCLFADGPIRLEPAREWSGDRWAVNQDERTFMPNNGYWMLNEGKARGTLIGGNLGTLNLLQGTEFMPSLDGSVLFVEDAGDSQPPIFDRDLQSLIQQPGFSGVRALVIGRFEPASAMTRELLQKIVTTKRELRDLPVIGNVDFGHTSPLITFPIGGEVAVETAGTGTEIVILKH